MAQPEVKVTGDNLYV